MTQSQFLRGSTLLLVLLAGCAPADSEQSESSASSVPEPGVPGPDATTPSPGEDAAPDNLGTDLDNPAAVEPDPCEDPQSFLADMDELVLVDSWAFCNIRNVEPGYKGMGPCNDAQLDELIQFIVDGNEREGGDYEEVVDPACWLTPVGNKVIRYIGKQKEEGRDIESLAELTSEDRAAIDQKTEAYEAAQQSNAMMDRIHRMKNLDMAPAIARYQLFASGHGSSASGDGDYMAKGECPEGWAEFDHVCYAILTRNSQAPGPNEDANDFIESRAATCFGARVALIHPEDHALQAFATGLHLRNQSTYGSAKNGGEAIEDIDGESDRGIWVRRHLFNAAHLQQAKGQPWLLFVTMGKRLEETSDSTYVRLMREDNDMDNDVSFASRRYEADILIMHNLPSGGGAFGAVEKQPGDCEANEDDHYWSTGLLYPCPDC